MAEDPIPDPLEQHLRNGWTADGLQAYNDAIEQNIQARHFGGHYADPDVDRAMRQRAGVKKMKCQNVASYNPLEW